jgi:signal transduction histidine kinase
MASLPFRSDWITWRSGLLCAPLLLVILMGVASYQNRESFKERVNSSDRVFSLLAISTELFTELQDSESGKRGYLLTGDESFLTPFRRAVTRCDAIFGRLIPVAGVIPNGPERLRRLKILSDAKLAEMQLAVDLYRSKGLPAALAVVENEAAQNHMAQIRAELVAFIGDGYRAREAQRTAGVKATTRTSLIIIIGAASLFLLLAFATFMIERDQQRQRMDAEQIQELNQTLENKVRDRTRALEEANKELEAFCYSVSHDLRAPLRSVDGFAKMLMRDYKDRPLDARGADLMQRMSASTLRMGQLIEDLLNLSRIARGGILPTACDLTALAASVVQDLETQHPGRKVEVSIEPGLSIRGDPRLLRVALENLFGNAWKFTRQELEARVAFGRMPDGSAFFVRDNGVGFDMAHSKQLFVPFQRLHRETEFEGTGIGLATVERVVQSHGGRIWAESKPGFGATFYFTIETERRNAVESVEQIDEPRKIDPDRGGQPGRRTAHA